MRREHSIEGAIFLALAVASLVVACCINSVNSEIINQNALSFLDPLREFILLGFRSVTENALLYYNTSFLIIVISTIVAVGWGAIQRQWIYVSIICALFLCSFGEYLTLINFSNYSVIAYTASIIPILFSLFKERNSNSHQTTNALKQGWWPFIFIFGIFLILIALRFYAINRCPVHFDGEGCYFRLTQSSFSRIIGHEAGVTPQTSGGFLWHLLYYAIGNTNEPAVYHVIIRNLSASLGIVKLLVFFLFLLINFGRFEALLGLILMGFGPPDNWWARQPFFHHLPGLITILLVWATLNLVKHLRWRDFLLTSFLMFTTRLLYPSGVFGFLIPFSCLGTLLIFDWKNIKRHMPKFLLPIFASVLWVVWLSFISWSYWGGSWKFLPPFLVPSHAALPETLSSKLYTVFITNGFDLIRNIFLEYNDQSHWTNPLTIPPIRTATSLTLILAFIGVVRMVAFRWGRIDLVLFWWLVWSAAPALSTQIADRRLGSFHIALITLAAIEGGRFVNELRLGGYRKTDFALRRVGLPVYASFLALFGAGALFGGQFGRPFSSVYGEEIRRYLGEDTLVVYATPDIECEVFFGVYKNIIEAHGKLGWVGVEGDFEKIKSSIKNPTFNADAWTYRDTKQSEIFPDSGGATRWKRYLFVLTPHPESARILEYIRESYPSGRYWRADLECNGGNDKCPMDFVEYSVK